MSFLGSLIWPIIDTYWSAVVFIMSLLPNKFVQESAIFDKVRVNSQIGRFNGLRNRCMKMEYLISMSRVL